MAIFPVFEELEAVDAAGEGFFIGWIVKSGIHGGAPDLDDVAELLHVVVDGTLEKTVLGEAGSAALDVTIDAKHDDVIVFGAAVGRRGHRWDETGVRNEERTHAVPVALLACRTEIHAVDGGTTMASSGVDVFGFVRRARPGIVSDGPGGRWWCRQSAKLGLMRFNCGGGRWCECGKNRRSPTGLAIPAPFGDRNTLPVLRGGLGDSQSTGLVQDRGSV